MNYVGTINLKHICEGKKIGKRAYSYLDKYRDFPRKNSSLFCVPFTMRKHVIDRYSPVTKDKIRNMEKIAEYLKTSLSNK